MTRLATIAVTGLAVSTLLAGAALADRSYNAENRSPVVTKSPDSPGGDLELQNRGNAYNNNRAQGACVNCDDD